MAVFDGVSRMLDDERAGAGDVASDGERDDAAADERQP